MAKHKGFKPALPRAQGGLPGLCLRSIFYNIKRREEKPLVVHGILP
jgi:hypothetical protein